LSSHQILGLIIFAALLLQLGLGLSHHLIYRRTKKPTILGKIHLFLGPAVILLALTNGGLGFNLAMNPQGKVPYAVVVAVVGLAFITARAWLFFGRRPAAYRPDEEGLQAYKTFGPGFSPTTGGYQDLQTPVSVVSAHAFEYEMKDQLGNGQQHPGPR